MQVSDILKAKGDRVVTIDPDTKVRDIAGILREKPIDAALVSGQDRKMVGIVSERDIVRGIAEHSSEILDGPAADPMSRSVVTCRPETSIEELMEQKLAKQIRHVPVYEDDRMAGIISISDVVKGVLSELQWREKVLRQQVVKAAGWSTEED